MLTDCTLCPRNCHVNRTIGELGFCHENASIRAARAALHFWEEPCISGESGSGTVFFSGCNLRCVFCQNYSIAVGDSGKIISKERLCDIFLELQDKKANNINLVTPTHFIPQIKEALIMAKHQGLSIPIVYNSGGYEKVESLRLLDGLIDVYLPDCKYFSPELSKKYSHCEDYFSYASQAIAEMVRQTGSAVFSGSEDDDAYSDNNLITRGVIVRHLLLPGCLEDSKKVISHLHQTFGNRIYISIMNQYTPLPHVRAYPGLNRRVTDTEYEALIDYAIEIGVENGFIQGEQTSEESFIPPFDYEGI